MVVVRGTPDIGDTMERRQVPIYLGAIVIGTLVGWAMPEIAGPLEHAINPAIAALLFVTFLQVPVASLLVALRDLRFLVTLLVANFVVVPLIVGALLPLLPTNDPIRLGALLVLLCPCIDYVIVFTGLADGDNRRLLAATPVLLIAQMLLLPLYLRLLLGDEHADVLDSGPFLSTFLVLIVIPLTLAWIVQAGGRRSSVVARIRPGLDLLMVPLMVVVLAMVVAVQVPTLTDHGIDIARLIPVYAGFLAIAAGVGLLLGRLAALPRDGQVAVAFSAATRNSLVVLPLALALPAGYDAAASAVVSQTLVEVIGMVALVALLRPRRLIR